MLELISILIGVAAFAGMLRLCIRLFGQMPADPGLRALIAGEARQFHDTGPGAEPCWSEEIGRDGHFSYARAQCPNDLLMELDARARRRDFPIPIVYE